MEVKCLCFHVILKLYYVRHSIVKSYDIIIVVIFVWNEILEEKKERFHFIYTGFVLHVIFVKLFGK